MNTDRASAMRPLPHPRAVLVDPRRIWVAPERDAPRAGAPTLGGEGGQHRSAPEYRMDPGHSVRVGPVRYGRTPTWYAQISIDLRAINNLTAVTLYQWVPWDAIRPAATRS